MCCSLRSLWDERDNDDKMHPTHQSDPALSLLFSDLTSLARYSLKISVTVIVTVCQPLPIPALY